MPYVFGVDGGGSNCRTILTTDDGRTLHAGRGPSVNYHEVGAGQATRIIEKLFKEALEAAHAAPRECKAACLGLAGAGREQDKRTLSPLFDNIFSETPYMLVGDAEIALASGAMSDSGILVMAGTGSMVFGRSEHGQTGRVGGYGPLVSDDGSGYRIGVEAIRAALKSHDGVEGETALGAILLKHLDLKDMDELVSWTNSDQATRRRVAELAPLVIRAANEDDPAAEAILNQEADSLALGVYALHKRMEFKENVQVVMSGGLLLHSSYYNQLLRRKIMYLIQSAAVNPPKLEPIFGAALYAYSLAGIDISDDLLDTMQRSHREVFKRSSQEMASNPDKLTPIQE